MLNEILKGNNRRSEIELKRVSKNIGRNPNICWYPSAGADFRDLLETHVRTNVSPDLYLHTDYRKDINIKRGTIFNDGRTVVKIITIHELTCQDEIKYYVDAEYISSLENSYDKPRVLLLDVVISFSGGEIRKPVLYFYMENINFFDEILLRFCLPISHIVKVNEGMAWGGNRKSITICYAFLSNLKTQYLLIDNSAQADLEIVNIIRDKRQVESKNFRLRYIPHRGVISDWSRRMVAIMNVDILDEVYSDDNFDKNLDMIRNLKLNY